MNTKLKSFTLSEIIVVMAITAIVVGMAFSVLRLVEKQIHKIQMNFDTTNGLLLLEQRLCQDFNESNKITRLKNQNQFIMESGTDTISYTFKNNYIIRGADTIKLKVHISKTFFQAQETEEGLIDAAEISATQEVPDYSIFISKKNDLTLFMNQNGF